MKFRVEFDRVAVEQLKAMPRAAAAEILKYIRELLTHQPRHESKSRIKHLRELPWPEYRLRVGTGRVFYVVIGNEVRIVAVLSKDNAVRWLNHLRGEAPEA